MRVPQTGVATLTDPANGGPGRSLAAREGVTSTGWPPPPSSSSGWPSPVVDRAGAWLLGAVGAVVLAALLGLNAASPETVVVRLNVDRAEHTCKLDVDYLASL